MPGMKAFRRPHNAPLFYAILAILYLVLSLAISPNHATLALYHLSNKQYRILIFLILLPLLAIWWAAFYGYAKTKEYASLIEDTPEGPPFHYIANGMMWLAWGLPIPALISLAVTSIANNHPGFTSASIIISNYASLLVPLIALHILSTGSRNLLELAHLRITSRNTKMLVLLFVLLGAVYCYYVFNNLHGRTSASNPYGLDSWLVLLTIVVPYLYAWFVGLLAAYEIRLVSRHSQGVLYRRGLQLLSLGLGVTVASSIALQYLHSVLPRDSHLSLGYTLLLIYALLAIIGVGYVLLAAGAQRLKKIEEV